MHDVDGGDRAAKLLEQHAASLDPEYFERIDTHAATIFLCKERAWKLKRAVQYGYLDFSTPERRRAALEAELSLNRRTAPDLYLGLRSVNKDAEGNLTIVGTGAPVEWYLGMRRFPDNALLAHLAERGELNDSLLTRLADGIHSFHARARTVRPCDGAERMNRIINGNEVSLATFADTLDRAQVGQVIGAQRELLETHCALLDTRAGAGRVRHCHGDLHLANVAVIDGEPTPFDCLEFSEELASIDVLYDLSFLLMDLAARGLHHGANLVLNRYLDLSAEDEDGKVLMPLFMSVRATVRAHVAAASAAQNGRNSGAEPLLRLAAALLKPSRPILVAIGGRSGTGKSSVARIVGDLGQTPGARILRSDVLRKRLAGVPPEARLPPSSYTSASSLAVYAPLAEAAQKAITSGQSVIADAVFETEAERSALESVARSADVPFCGIWLDAPESLRIERVQKRTSDASDADASVARRQTSRSPGNLGIWRVVSADRPLQAIADDVLHQIAQG